MLQALIGPVTGLLDKFVEDKDQKNALAHEIATLAEKQAHEAAMAQVSVNQAEAKHRSHLRCRMETLHWMDLRSRACITTFSGFAPLILFGAGLGLVQKYLSSPAFDMDSLMTVLLGMLGLGGMRTFEKAKGLTK